MYVEAMSLAASKMCETNWEHKQETKCPPGPPPQCHHELQFCLSSLRHPVSTAPWGPTGLVGLVELLPEDVMATMSTVF